MRALNPPPADVVGSLRGAIAALQGSDTAACAAQLDAVENALEHEEAYDPSSGSKAEPFRAAWPDAMGAWQTAIDTVSAQLDELSATLLPALRTLASALAEAPGGR